MLNPENRPTTRILPDGKIMPTNKGLTMTDKEKHNLSVAKMGWEKPLKQVIEESTIWNTVWILGLRGGSPVEIADVTDYTLDQVQAALNAKGRVHRVIEGYNLPENVLERRRRVGVRNMRMRWGPPWLPHELASREFARRLVLLGEIFDSNLSSWESVSNILKDQGRKITDVFAYGLVIEAWWDARSRTVAGDKSFQDKYFQLGQEVDPAWFKSDYLNIDRRLITQMVSPESNSNGFHVVLSGGVVQSVAAISPK